MSNHTNDPNCYNFPFRENFEFKIMLVWFAAGFACFVVPFITGVPQLPYFFGGLGCFIVGVLLGQNGIVIYIRKQKLKGYPLEFIKADSDESLKLFGITDKEVLNNVKANRK